MKDDTSLRLSVDSCDGLKLVGTAHVAPDDLIKGRSDPIGVKRVVTYIESKCTPTTNIPLIPHPLTHTLTHSTSSLLTHSINQPINQSDEWKEITGKLKVAYLIEAVRNPPKFSVPVAAAAAADDDMEDLSDLAFPFKVAVRAISASELQQGAYSLRLVPFVKVLCDEQSEQTKKCRKMFDDVALWEGLGWEFVVERHDSDFKIEVYSSAGVLGVLQFDGYEVMTYPRNNKGVTELQGSITMDARLLQEMKQREKEEKARNSRFNKLFGNGIKELTKFAKDSGLPIEEDKNGDDNNDSDDGERGKLKVVSSIPSTGKVKVTLQIKLFEKPKFKFSTVKLPTIAKQELGSSGMVVGNAGSALRNGLDDVDDAMTWEPTHQGSATVSEPASNLNIGGAVLEDNIASADNVAAVEGRGRLASPVPLGLSSTAGPGIITFPVKVTISSLLGEPPFLLFPHLS